MMGSIIYIWPPYRRLMNKTKNNMYSHYNISDLFLNVDKFPINKKIIPQNKLDITNKTRSSLFPWRGQFSPELIEILLGKFSKPQYTILDPFAGSGTTLFESARKNLACYGAEINPAAVEMSRIAHFTNLSVSKRNYYIKKAKGIINDHLPLTKDGLFHYINKEIENSSNSEILKEMLEECSHESFEYTIIINTLLRYFANNKKKTLSETSRLSNSFKLNAKLVRSLPYDENPCKVFHTDARKIPLDKGTINLIITSPPVY
jgi:hypothetical protein